MDNLASVIVILGYCSLPAGECDAVAVVKPEGANFVSVGECRAMAKGFNEDKNEVETILEQMASVPPPWNTYAKCGTRAQLNEIKQAR